MLTGSPAFVGTDGNATITSLGIPKSAGDGSHTVYALGDAAYLPSQASAGIVIDTTAPVMSAQLSPTPGAGGWNNTSPVSVALSADDGTGSGVSQFKYTTDGSDPKTSGTAQVYTGSPFNVSAQGTTTVKYFADDVAGNSSAVQTQLVKIDTTPPTNAVSLTGVSGGLYPTAGPLASGSTIYYRGAAAGSFTITNAVADALSGPASSATSSFAGGSSGWSHTPSLVTTPAGGPYVSAAFSWSPGSTSSPSETVTGRDVATNFASTTLNFTDDSTGPSGGSVDATGLGGTGGRYSTSTTLSISLAKGTDSGSGLATTGAQLLRASALLSSSNGIAAGSCGSYGGYAQVGSNDPSSPYTDNAAGGITTGHCYRYEYVVSDNVGNTTTYTSPDVMVDTTGPSAPSLSLSSATGNTYINGTTAYINAQAGKSGSFQAHSHQHRQRLRPAQGQLPQPHRLLQRRRRQQQLPLPDHLQLVRSRRSLRLTNNHRLQQRQPHQHQHLHHHTRHNRPHRRRPHRQRHQRNRRRLHQLQLERQLDDRHDQRLHRLRLRPHLLDPDAPVRDAELLQRDRRRQLRQLRQRNHDRQPRHPDRPGPDRPHLLPLHAHRPRQRRQHRHHHHHRHGRHDRPVGAVAEPVERDRQHLHQRHDRLHQRPGRQVGQLPGPQPPAPTTTPACSRSTSPAPQASPAAAATATAPPTRPPTTGPEPSQPQAHKQPPPTTTPTSPTPTPSPSHPTQPPPPAAPSPSTAPTQPAPAPPATTRAATGRSARSATTPTPAPASPPRS